MVDINVNNFYEAFDSKNDQPVTAEQMMASVISTLANGIGGLPGESHNTKLVNALFTQNNFAMLDKHDPVDGRLLFNPDPIMIAYIYLWEYLLSYLSTL